MAVINIEIPIFLGKLVDTVTSYLMSVGASTSQEASAFMENLKEPATKLVLLYLAQVFQFFIEISFTKARKKALTCFFKISRE